MKLMKFQLQGPSFHIGNFQGPGRSPIDALANIRKKLDKSFPKLDNNPKTLHAITNNEL